MFDTSAPTTAPTTEPIPQRPALPVVGHTFQVPRDFDGLAHLIAEAGHLGPIYRLRFTNRELTVVTGVDLVAELSDERRFRKCVHTNLVELRDSVGDGLFTAYNDEPNWRKAHDILLPAFSLSAMRGYHASMLQVARSLLSTWDNAADRPVDVAADMTRLTFDTIGLCGFGFDFESFHRSEPHPAVTAIVELLAYAQFRTETLPALRPLHAKRAARYREHLSALNAVVDEVIQRRKAMADPETGDLLGRMLTTRDAVTGEPLDDLNIRYQIITFLGAGHETTSGALSFALYYLTKHPEVLARAQAEVDALWGTDPDPNPGYEDIGKLTYVRQVLNESLRLWPTAPAYAVEPVTENVIGGKYVVRPGDMLMVLAPRLHRDPAWGDNVELFDPDRFAPEHVDTRPVHLFKPFGNGERACIGRQFALHEATMVLGLLIHRYRLIDHADYTLKIKKTLTLKPEGFTLRLARRGPAERRLPATSDAIATPLSSSGTASGTALTVLYGSNLGTCAGIARDLAADGTERGFTTSVASLNDAVNTLTPGGGPVVIVVASYNGKPTDDAAEFVSWLENLTPGALTGVSYALLGVGDRNWAATYQRIPTLIDERLTAAGATALMPRGTANAAGDFAGAVERWTHQLWATMLARYGTGMSSPAEARRLYTVEEVGEPETRHGLVPMTVLDTADLVDTSHPLGRPKRYLRLALPEGTSYRTGDHLAVLPRNPASLVRQVATRFFLELDKTVRLRAHRRRRDLLPVDQPLTLRRLLTEFVELRDTATPDQVATLAEHTGCPRERRVLTELASAPRDQFRTQVTEPGRSVLDLLQDHLACDLPFELFLELLPSLRPRHYSISSSASATPDTVDLMVSLRGDRGVASQYLNNLRAGDIALARVNPCQDAFRLPQDPSTPVIAVSAGTGLAPFRGAVLDRLRANAAGPMMLYFGCDHPEVDYLHRAELEAAQAAGVVSLRPTFAHQPEHGARYVQHRILREEAEVWAALRSGGRVYVCGDGNGMATGVRQAFARIYRSQTGADTAEADAWLATLTGTGRYVEDVWTDWVPCPA